MSLKELHNRILIMDGAMGTMLQACGLNKYGQVEGLPVTHPFELSGIHRQYVDAGADIIYSCTFGANRYKLKDTGFKVEDVIREGIQAARLACNEDTMVAASIGPLGSLMEPMGEMMFEEAYEGFREVVVEAENAGADLVVFETMTDIYEVKAAVLAAKENTSLPIFVSMTFEENGRTYTGCSIENMVVTMEPLGVEALGINCSLGPIEIFPLARELCRLTTLPVFVKPNAGLPDPETGRYDISSQQFIETMQGYLELGVNMIGGCCGTTPEYIKGLAEALLEEEPMDKLTRERGSKVCSSTRVIGIDGAVVIGERLNPTGKPSLKKALAEENMDYIIAHAIEQVKEGAQILDVNVGAPDVDEETVLPMVIKKIQSVTDIPLQIDSSNPRAIEAALRIYNGKPVVNSVSGEQEKLNEILPLIKHYGAAVVGLTLNENGIPDTAEGRFNIASEILKCAKAESIPEEDVFIDCLTLTASAEQNLVKETLKAVHMVRQKLGLKTVLGVSNISFGLPNRSLINRTFLAAALQEGLDMPIMNPGDADMMGTVAAFRLLAGSDKNAAAYIETFKDWKPAAALPAEKKSSTAGKSIHKTGNALVELLLSGMNLETRQLVSKLLENNDELTVINDYLIPALDVIGKAFETGEIFLPQMMQAAAAAQEGFDVVKKYMAKSGRVAEKKGPVVIATVEGDIHDIGKNIVKNIMENYGFEIIDLGKDVPAERIVEAVVEKNVRLLGLSALMTTTLSSMEKTISAVRAVKPDCKIMVGGAVLTESYAFKIGADYYCADAIKSVEAAREIFG